MQVAVNEEQNVKNLLFLIASLKKILLKNTWQVLPSFFLDSRIYCAACWFSQNNSIAKILDAKQAYYFLNSQKLRSGHIKGIFFRHQVKKLLTKGVHWEQTRSHFKHWKTCGTWCSDPPFTCLNFHYRVSASGGELIITLKKNENKMNPFPRLKKYVNWALFSYFVVCL